MTQKLGKYRIFVDDNYHYMDETARHAFGSTDDLEAAIARCKGVVERSLEECYKPGISAGELYGCYQMFGEDPFIVSDKPGKVEFSAWDYAKARSQEICGEAGTGSRGSE